MEWRSEQVQADHVLRETRDRPLVPSALWWSRVDRAALWTSGSDVARRPRPALRTGRWTCPRGSFWCWAETPAGPGTSDTMPRKDEESGWQGTGQRWRWFHARQDAVAMRWSTWVLAWDFWVLLFHSIGINRSGWSIYWQRVRNQKNRQHERFGQSSQSLLAWMYFFGIPLVISLGSRPTRRLKNGKVA